MNGSTIKRSKMTKGIIIYLSIVAFIMFLFAYNDLWLGVPFTGLTAGPLAESLIYEGIL